MSSSPSVESPRRELAKMVCVEVLKKLDDFPAHELPTKLVVDMQKMSQWYDNWKHDPSVKNEIFSSQTSMQAVVGFQHFCLDIVTYE